MSKSLVVEALEILLDVLELYKRIKMFEVRALYERCYEKCGGMKKDEDEKL